MERHEILEMMAELKLLGMRLAFDEVLADGLKRQHAAQQIIGDLLAAEIAEKHARSIRYQVSAAKLPLAKELADFEFLGSPINEGLVRELAVGTFLSQQRNAVLVGGTGTGKSHLAVGCSLVGTQEARERNPCHAFLHVRPDCIQPRTSQVTTVGDGETGWTATAER